MTKRLHIYGNSGTRINMIDSDWVLFCYYFVTSPQIYILIKHLLVLNLHQLNKIYLY